MTPEAKQKRLELLRKIGEKYKDVEFAQDKPNEVVVLDASIPVSKQEVMETVKEDLDAFREDQRDKETESEALTSDEK